jgi:Flp pilus assembly protein TadD
MAHLRSFLFAVLVIFTASLSHADQQWVEVKSPHFSVITDAGDKRGREVALRFEHMRMAFGLLFHNVNVDTAPVEIIGFRSSKEMKQVAPLYEGKPIDVSGLYMGSRGRGSSKGAGREYILLDLSVEEGFGVAFHEYAHLLINSNFPPMPIWFDEGFAEYSSSLKVARKEVTIGLVRPDLPQILLRNPWLRITDLFSVQHDSPIYNRDDHRSVFYAESWISVHYFMSQSAEMMKKLAAYDRLLRGGATIPDAIRAAFGMEPEQLEKAIRDYFRNDRYLAFKTTVPEGAENINMTSRVLDDLETSILLADVDVHTPDYEQRGLAAFQQIASKQPDNPLVNRALGYAALKKEDWQKAEQYFTRATAQPVKDPQTYYLLALAMTRGGIFNNQSPEELDKVRKLLNTAISLDPNYADAYGLLGVTLSFAESKDDAVNALKKAMALSPRNEFYVYNLVGVFLRFHDVDNAVALLKFLQNSSDPQIVSMAQFQLQNIEQYKTLMTERKQSRLQVDPSGQPISGFRSTDKSGEESSETTPDSTQPILFINGTLLSVDCSQAPGAVLTVSARGKTWKMLAADMGKIVLIGTDEFSCNWKNKKVNVNYHDTGKLQGNVVALEIQE